MPETYICLNEAAALESIGYDTMKKRVQRSAREFKVTMQPSENGGKDQVLVAVSSLSVKARRAHRAAQKLEGRDAVIETRTEQPERPWYLDMDIHWYRQNYSNYWDDALALADRIRQFLDRPESERTASAVAFAAELGMSQRTMYRNAETYLEASAWALRLNRETGENHEHLKVLALCRKPKAAGTFPSLPPEQRALIENIWFDKDFASNLGTIEMLYDKFSQIAGDNGWTYPSIKTVARYVKYLMDSRRGANAHFLAANGLRAFKNQKMIKGKRDTKALAVLEFVQGDEHTLDCWVQVTHANGKLQAVRPKLVAWIDTRSRAIMGDVMCIDANTEILQQSILKMVYPPDGGLGGLPKHLHIDNGKDYTSLRNTGQARNDRQCHEAGDDLDGVMLGFYRSIGIEDWSRSLPYQPWGKGQIERFFGSVCSMFTKWLASYTGTLTGSKTAAKRQKDVKAMLERGELLTMETFFNLWTEWKNNVYHQRAHDGLRDAGEQILKPGELFENADRRYEKPAPPKEFAAMLLLRADKALVRNQGIRKFGQLYTSYELSKYVGDKVNIRWDANDITKLYVYGLDGHKICEAVSQELLLFAPGASQDALTKHIRNQKRQVKDAQEQYREYITPYEQRIEPAEGGTPKVVGGIDLTIRAKTAPKVVALPTDKQYRQETATKKKTTTTNEYLEAKAQEALGRLAALG